MSFTGTLQNVIGRDEQLDVDHVALLSAVQDLNLIAFQAIRLAVFQHEQLERLARLVPPEHAAEATLILKSSDERGEAIAAEFAAWAGPELPKMLAEFGIDVQSLIACGANDHPRNEGSE